MGTHPDPVESFSSGLVHLRAYASREGHTHIGHSYREGYFSLGRWVEDVRSMRDKLDPLRVRELDAIREWNWELPTRRNRADSKDNFEAGYHELLRFVELKGHARVPQMQKGQTTQLGNWVKAQRDAKRSGRLSHDEANRLGDLPGWEWDAQDAAFLDHAEQFSIFVHTFAHGKVPQLYVDPESGFGLGRWVRKQHDGHAKGVLLPERVKILTELAGWCW